MSKSLPLMGAVLCLGAALAFCPGQPCWAEWGEPSPAEQRIADELKKPTELQFIETPLQDLIDTLKGYHQIEVQLDRRSLDEVGIPRDCPITKSLKGISLRSALRLLLRDLDLTYVIRDEVLLITTTERAKSSYLCTRVYPVSELLGSGSPCGREQQGCDFLIEAMMTCVVPESWSGMGGPGTGLTVPPVRPEALAVTQDPRVHEEIGDLLEAVRRAARIQADGQFQPASGNLLTTAAEKRIAKALSESTEIEFTDTPLQDVVDAIEGHHKITIQVDQRALDECGVPVDSPITKNLRGVSLASALNLMLRDLDLTYVVQDEVLLITTRDEAEHMRVTRVYPLNGLVVGRREAFRSSVRERWKRFASSQGPPDAPTRAFGSPGALSATGPELFTYPDLIKTITELIAPESWEDVGGRGNLSVLSLGPFEALVVMQTHEVHEQIAGLLGRPEFRRSDSSNPGRAPRRSNRPGRR